MMKLYRVTHKYRTGTTTEFYMVAEDESQASRMATKKWDSCGYSEGLVTTVELAARETSVESKILSDTVPTLVLV